MMMRPIAVAPLDGHVQRSASVGDVESRHDRASAESHDHCPARHGPLRPDQSQAPEHEEPMTVAITAALTALLVALVNGLFFIYGKGKLDKDLAVLVTELSVLRELAVKHFDRRADIYRDAIEPFIQLFVVTRSTGLTLESEERDFRRNALAASARIELFGSEHTRQRFTQMLDWSEKMLKLAPEQRPLDSAAIALEHARAFLGAARDDLFVLPQPTEHKKIES
jgi:hypothetical protein